MEKNLNDFIGRGEREAKLILQRLFPKAMVSSQVPIQKLVKNADFLSIDTEIQKHNFDLVVYNGPNTLVVEINYKHKEKAAKKWNNIFTNLLIDNHCIPVTIDDYNCEFLFSDSIRLRKNNPWGSYIDIIGSCNVKELIPMVRCSECDKSFKQHIGKCWNDGMCNKCWTKGRTLDYIAPKPTIKNFTTPIDMYLDQFVHREVQNIDN